MTFRYAFALIVFAWLLPRSLSAAEVRSVEVEAAAGEPLGVGRVTVFFGGAVDSDEERFWLEAEEDRVMYPAFGSAPPVRGLLRGLLDVRPASSTAYFLFRGDEPFEMQVFTPQPTPVTVRPRQDPGLHRALLGTWWSEYQSRGDFVEPTGDFPPQAQNYLTAMLGRRLGLGAPQEPVGLLELIFEQPELEDALAPLLGAESQRVAVQRATMLEHFSDEGPAELPLPPAPEGPPPAIQRPAPDVEIEPIASRVPAECFYVRTGNFQNFLWMQDTLKRAAGDLRNLLAVRGVNYQLTQRMERMIALRQTELSRTLGPLVVADVALIGTDTFLREGAAIGVLFQASNNLLLATDIQRQRREALEKYRESDEAEERQVQIAGHQVAFLSTPDGDVRSFYATDGDYHLVTTSEYLVRRFYETGQGNGTLAEAPDFRLARSILPLGRKDTLFFFAGDAFFENLISPQYRIEMKRRLRAVGNLELAQLARLAARGEGRPSESLEDLIAGGFLPEGFGTLPDGSRTVRRGERYFDSLRGARGSFLPVPDAPLDAVTAEELEDYRSFVDYYRGKWGRLDPLAAGVNRKLSDDGRVEQIAIDVSAAPFTQASWWTGFLGPPDTKRLRPVLGDLVSVELKLGSQHLFAGLRDVRPLPSPWQIFIPAPRTVNGYLARYLLENPANYLMGYLGTTSGEGPAAGWFDRENFGPPDADGFRHDGLVWRDESGGYIVLSFQRDVLAAVTPHLAFEEAPQPAQGRLHVGDLSRSNVAGMLNMLGFVRARRTSEGNMLLMESLTRQLDVPPAEAKATAERILDAQLVCPVGKDDGESYVLRADDWGHGRWISPELTGRDAGQDYIFPPLEWFRGLHANFALIDGRLRAHIDVGMELPRERQPARENGPPPPDEGAPNQRQPMP